VSFAQINSSNLTKQKRINFYLAPCSENEQNFSRRQTMTNKTCIDMDES